MIVLVILHGNVVGVPHFQPLKEFIQGRLIGVIIFPDFTSTKHFHDHWKVLFFLRCFIEKIEDDGRQQHGCRRIPEGILGLAPLGGGCFEQIRDQLLHIVIRVQIGKGIEAMAFLHGEKIQHLDLITPHFEECSRHAEQFTLAVQHKIGSAGLEQVNEGIEAALTRTTATNHNCVQIAPVLSAIQAHADVLGEYLVGFRSFIPILFVDRRCAAPFGGAVFLAPAVVTAGGQGNSDAHDINEHKNKDSFLTVLA